MDPLEQVKKLREEYERSLDEAESRRVAYHKAVLDLYRGGTPLREIAQQLGLSHQRVHQIVSGEPPRKRTLRRAAGGAAALVALAVLFGGLRIAQAPPFTTQAQAAPGPINTARLSDNGLFKIFPDQISSVACQVPRGGGLETGPWRLLGTCTTQIRNNFGQDVQVVFTERWHWPGERSWQHTWIVVVGPTGHVISTQSRGVAPPQSWG